MRAVADTNLLISGLLRGGTPGRLLAIAREGSLRLCSSEVLLAELEQVLKRPKLVARLTARGESAQAVSASVRSICEIVAAQPSRCLPSFATRKISQFSPAQYALEQT